MGNSAGMRNMRNTLSLPSFHRCRLCEIRDPKTTIPNDLPGLVENLQGNEWRTRAVALSFLCFYRAYSLIQTLNFPTMVFNSSANLLKASALRLTWELPLDISFAD